MNGTVFQGSNPMLGKMISNQVLSWSQWENLRMQRAPWAAFCAPDGSLTILPELQEIDPKHWFNRCLPRVGAASNPSFPGYLALLAYDPWLGLAEGLPHRVFRANRGISVPLPPASRFCPSALQLHPHDSKKRFEDKVAFAIEEIRQGRYYQINLLRFFDLASDEDIYENLCQRFFRDRPEFGSLLSCEGLKLISFSPEQFVRIFVENGDWCMETRPIKGTIMRGNDEIEDEALIRKLKSSSKEISELNMIVDLMRNDLQSVSLPQSVVVDSPGDVYTLPTLHHRVAKVKSRLNPSQSYGDLFQALLPAGSITGAPKREAQKAIFELENRPRDYFMGCMVYCGDNGAVQSSVLIRTAFCLPGRNMKYAAGSGIVLASIPEKEADEVTLKCQFLIQDRGCKNQPSKI